MNFASGSRRPRGSSSTTTRSTLPSSASRSPALSSGVPEEQEGRPPRNVYSITPVGLELLHDLLADLPPELAGDELEFLTRLGQFSLLEPDERLAILDARDQALEARIHHLTALLDRAQYDLWNREVTTELIRRCSAETEWLAGLRDSASTAPLSKD